MQQAMLLM